MRLHENDDYLLNWEQYETKLGDFPDFDWEGSLENRREANVKYLCELITRLNKILNCEWNPDAIIFAMFLTLFKAARVKLITRQADRYIRRVKSTVVKYYDIRAMTLEEVEYRIKNFFPSYYQGWIKAKEEGSLYTHDDVGLVPLQVRNLQLQERVLEMQGDLQDLDAAKQDVFDLRDRLRSRDEEIDRLRESLTQAETRVKDLRFMNTYKKHENPDMKKHLRQIHQLENTLDRIQNENDHYRNQLERQQKMEAEERMRRDKREEELRLSLEEARRDARHYRKQRDEAQRLQAGTRRQLESNAALLKEDKEVLDEAHRIKTSLKQVIHEKDQQIDELSHKFRQFREQHSNCMPGLSTAMNTLNPAGPQSYSAVVTGKTTSSGFQAIAGIVAVPNRSSVQIQELPVESDSSGARPKKSLQEVSTSSSTSKLPSVPPGLEVKSEENNHLIQPSNAMPYPDYRYGDHDDDEWSSPPQETKTAKKRPESTKVYRDGKLVPRDLYYWCDERNPFHPRTQTEKFIEEESRLVPTGLSRNLLKEFLRTNEACLAEAHHVARHFLAMLSAAGGNLLDGNHSFLPLWQAELCVNEFKDKSIKGLKGEIIAGIHAIAFQEKLAAGVAPAESYIVPERSFAGVLFKKAQVMKWIPRVFTFHVRRPTSAVSYLFQNLHLGLNELEPGVPKGEGGWKTQISKRNRRAVSFDHEDDHQRPAEETTMGKEEASDQVNESEVQTEGPTEEKQTKEENQGACAEETEVQPDTASSTPVNTPHETSDEESSPSEDDIPVRRRARQPSPAHTGGGDGSPVPECGRSRPRKKGKKKKHRK